MSFIRNSTVNGEPSRWGHSSGNAVFDWLLWSLTYPMGRDAWWAGDARWGKDAALAGLLRALGGTLGLLQIDPAAYLQGGGAAAGGLDEATIQALIADRAAAKAAKNFTEADRIRQDLLAQGVVLKDSATGTTWERS